MNSFFKYLRAQLKRALQLYPAIIAFTLALVLGVSLLLIALIGSRGSTDENAKIKVGIVGDLNNSYLDIGIAALQSMDASRFYVEFIELDEQTANAQLSSGDLKGYVKIPKGFVDSVANGGDLKLKYVMGNSPAVLSSLLMQEIINVIGSVVTESQCAVYGYMDLLDKSGYSRKLQNRLAEGLTIEYIDKILTREQWYDIETLGFGKGLSFEAYYICAFLTLLMLLWGTVCVDLLTHRELSLQRLLFSKNRGVLGQTLAEYIPFLAIFAANLILLGVISGAMLGGKELPIYLSGFTGFFSFLKFSFYLIPAALLITALQFMLYELTSGVVAAVLLQVFALVALSYASGLLYPIYSLPATLQKIAVWLPTGVAFDYVGSALTANIDAAIFFKTIAYGAVFLAVAAAVRKLKIRGGRI